MNFSWPSSSSSSIVFSLPKSRIFRGLDTGAGAHAPRRHEGGRGHPVLGRPSGRPSCRVRSFHCSGPLPLRKRDVAEEAQTIDRDELRPPKLGASDNDSLEIWEGNRKSSIYFGAVGNDDEKMTTNTTKTATVAVAALALVAMTLAYSALVLPASAQLASTSTTTSTTPTTQTATPTSPSNSIRPQWAGQAAPFRGGEGRGNLQQANLTVGQTITMTSTSGKYYAVGSTTKNGTASGTVTFTVTSKLSAGWTVSLTQGTIVVNGTTYTVSSGTAQMDRAATNLVGQGATTPSGQFLIHAAARGSFVGTTTSMSLDLSAGTTEYLVFLSGTAK
jgi:hypothetical protein